MSEEEIEEHLQLQQISDGYLMENAEEAFRLEIKTDPEAVRQQARWSGVSSGMRVLDVGCGSGKTTSILHEMVQPGGLACGIDFSTDRISYAKMHYGHLPGIDFSVCNFKESLKGIGQFDLIWVRFVLEYFLAESQDIVKNISRVLKPGGALCLLDLDYNCLSHYELPPMIGNLLPKLMDRLEKKFNFDIYAGRKLYSYLYDQGYQNIQVNLVAHHLFYGSIKAGDVYNWMKKIEINANRFRDLLEGYPGGCEAFINDFNKFLIDPRRFTYTPLIMCKGMKPMDC
ncbi:MAG: class I SAM-dependent methyltransferase [Pseudomonadota bacterium]